MAALLSQHVWDMQPCAWCVLQRLIFVALALAAGLGLVLPGALGSRIGAALALVLAGLGLATALWHHFVASSSASCNLTLADRVMGATGLDSLLPQVFAAYASCADARVDLAGMPYEFWSGALFTLLGMMALWALRMLRRPA
ncbi:MAG: disulfide bond formation protein B [Burkholderiaceae bacterium]|nr:disulfide bond formation protein B [Burkholderiaceae bacterium]